jgi:DNA segregation ATPase FtsK/SpoIIIE-like protein
MLVCGATGSGKSVFLRSTIEYALLGGVSEIYIFDPKHEYSKYSSIHGVTVVRDIEDIELQIMMLVEEMERRVKSHSTKKTLIVFDEFADAVANSRKGNELKNYGLQADGFRKDGSPKMKRVVVSTDKSLEENLRILLQKGRSSGFRIISATQRASTKVITGDAKVNFPIQVCFRVPKDIDSMVVLDEPGAEALNGRGDGLVKSPEYPGVIRFQAFYKE